MIKPNYVQGEYKSRMKNNSNLKGYNIGTGMGTSGFRKRNKRGKSFDQEKHIEIIEEEPIASIITQLPQNSKFSSSHERLFSFSPNRTQIDKLLPPKSRQYINKKTLVLDLDETLVHSGFKPFNQSDIILEIELDNAIHEIYVLIRPGAEEFLSRMAQQFELIIFTASLSKYADPLLDILDSQKYCSYRLFREHCTLINGSYVKDLKRLNRDLKDVIILDNSHMSYAFNPSNGFPITSWYENKNDKELYAISHILEFLGEVSDVRAYIPAMVENHELKFYKATSVMNEYSRHNKQQQSNQTSSIPTRQSNAAPNLTSNNINNNEIIIDNENKEDINTCDIEALASNNSKPTSLTRTSKEININIVTNNYTNYFISNNLQKSKDNQITDQEPSKSFKTALNIFRLSNTNSNMPTNSNANTMSNAATNANLKVIKINEPKTSKNSDLGNINIKSIRKGINAFHQKDAKYSSLLDRKDHGQLIKSTNIKRNNNRPVTSINQQTQTQIIEELNQRRKQRQNSKPHIFRSPSFQVTTPTATSTKNKIRPSSSNNNIHVITSSKKNKKNMCNPQNNINNNNKNNIAYHTRPKSSGRIIPSTSFGFQPKTPKMPNNNNKLTTPSTPLDDIFIKRRLLTTTRHNNKQKGTVNIKSVNFGRRISPMNY